ncbi:hypothetical protein PF005_g2872 [Phytophthora fragariae]|uniref:Major facilitator superfamily (MFS) profile domain-containing protein n=1 Tax=Phytophthora fragariae TaxID=53985 RepID=A0A6A3US08_9STRA|nr:hypothetical protein PF003_g92 [Phytophthora fragariae]KAE8947354.1 hypothetical protein PF009_g3055 [Phytophthora fragariae]KAE9027050.1 hypothetical protein PF011_g2240 [Phytophthora fragariae]KAE9134407.1 hypothetical protein PF010_g2457 [Phytophthora fragariae]KAE9134713.1 hypothetical protein PF007_g2825 [Phytophthora fragariae]
MLTASLFGALLHGIGGALLQAGWVGAWVGGRRSIACGLCGCSGLKQSIAPLTGGYRSDITL